MPTDVGVLGPNPPTEFVPARRRRSWWFLIGSIAMGSFMGSAAVWMPAKASADVRLQAPAGMFGLPFAFMAAGMFALAWMIMRAGMPCVDRAIERLPQGLSWRFRFRSQEPMQVALCVAWFLGMLSHFWMFAAVALTGSKDPWVTLGTCVGVSILGGVVGLVFTRRRWFSGTCDYVIDNDRRTFARPTPRQKERRAVPLTVPLASIRAVLLRGDRLILWLVEGERKGIPISMSVGLREHAFDAGRWIAEQLGVPLLQPSKAEERRLFEAQFPGLRKWLPFMVYAVLVIASFSYQHNPKFDTTSPVPQGVPSIGVPAFTSSGQASGPDVLMAYREFGREHGGVPVLLLHGSPGSAGDFDSLGPLLAAGDMSVWKSAPEPRRVIAPDLLGYGGTRGVFADRSIEAYARTMLAMMDRLKIERVHVVGWSNGGGVALHMADLAPERVVSVTMLASIGLQEHEPSGSYFFEHAKYKAAKVLLGVVPEFLPHFGLLGSYSSRVAWVEYFDDSDQRKLEGVMERVGERGTPTFILHGVHDFLVPAFAAEDHFHRIASSELLLIEASHFIPFVQPGYAVYMSAWFQDAERWNRMRADGTAASDPWRPWGPRNVINDISIYRTPTWLSDLGEWVRGIVRATPWWVQIVMVAGVAVFAPLLCVALGSLLVVWCSMDPVLLLSGMLLGFAVHAIGNVWIGVRRARTGRDAPSGTRWASTFGAGWSSQFVAAQRVHAAREIGHECGSGARFALRAMKFACGRFCGVVVWSAVAIIVAVAAEATVLGTMRHWFGGGMLGALGLLFTVVLLYFAVLVATSLLSRAGRCHLRVSLERLIHHEYWPTQAFYFPFYPRFLWMAAKNGGLRQVTCCNPEIEHGGGWAGESKVGIMEKLLPAGSVVLPTFLVPSMATAGERAEVLRSLMSLHESIREFPVVLKPNEAQRGHAFKLARSMEQAERYLGEMTAAAVVQPYHAGPEECGLFWMRYSKKQLAAGMGPDGRAIAAGRRGFVYSVTRKEFPVVVGDGKRTLERLVRSHPRYRRQASVFLARFGSEAGRVPSEGERVRLAVSGNHCQGTLFRDGGDLITPELEAEVDRIASVFPRLDYGRFDVRFTSEDELKAGRGLAIIELNGSSSEPTNMYDPDRSYFWAVGVLARMWRQVFELAKERRAEGVRPLSYVEFIRVIRMNAQSLTGSSVAD